MSTMGMQVELSMTAKGVQATLKDAQGAIVQTASIIKSQIPTASAEAGKGIAKFKEGLGRARETMMFFTSSLGEFGEGGRTAQVALSGLGSLFLGGGVVGLGLAAAQLGMKLLADEMGKESKAAEEAKKKNDEVFKKLLEDAGAAQRAVQDFRQKAWGIDPARTAAESGARALQPAIDKAKAELDAKRATLAQLQAKQDGGQAYAGQQDDIDAAAEKARIADQSYQDLLNKQTAFLEQSKQLGVTAAIEQANREQAERDAAEKERADKDKAAADARAQAGAAEWQAAWNRQEEEARRLMAAEEERRKAGEAEWAAAWQRQEEEARRLMAAEDERLKTAQKRFDALAQAGTRMGDVIGNAFAEMLLGAKSLGGAMLDVGRATVNMIIESVKTQIMADAVASAAAAFKSQAGIPVVGPFLAATAMVAALSTVQGLMSALPARAMGGSVDVNRPYLVGERGPEMFVPGQSGGIVPNSALGGPTIHFNMSFTDGQSARRFFLDNQPALAEAVGRALRDGRRFG